MNQNYLEFIITKLETKITKLLVKHTLWTDIDDIAGSKLNHYGQQSRGIYVKRTYYDLFWWASNKYSNASGVIKYFWAALFWS